MPLPEDEPYTRARQFYRKWPVKGNIQVDDIDGGKAGTKGSIRPVLPSIFLFPPLSLSQGKVSADYGWKRRDAATGVGGDASLLLIRRAKSDPFCRCLFVCV